MTNPLFHVKQNCSPSITSKVTGNKKNFEELLGSKKVSETSIPFRINFLQVYPAVPPFVFAVF